MPPPPPSPDIMSPPRSRPPISSCCHDIIIYWNNNYSYKPGGNFVVQLGGPSLEGPVDLKCCVNRLLWQLPQATLLLCWECQLCTHPLACSISNVPMFCWKVHSRTHTDEQKHSDFVLKICTRNWWEIIPDGAQMSNTSWFGGIYLGAMRGGLGAQGLKSRPDQFRMCKPPCSWLTHGGCFLVQQ